MMPRRADSEIEPMIATGMAINSGHGVATTSTARKRNASPLAAQAASAMAKAIGVQSAPSRSPSRRSLGRRLFRVPHDLHDLGVSGVHHELVGPDREGRVAVDGAGEHRRTRRLGHPVGLAREVGLVHHAMALDHRAVDRADLVGEDDQRCR